MAYTTAALNDAIDLAVKKLGYKKLKDKQREAIVQFVNGHDCFISLPTGYGKSVCYAVLPYLFDTLKQKKDSSTVLCVSPLISLMCDQKEKFVARGLRAEFIDVHDSTVLENVKQNKYQLIFVSPESLVRNPVWRQILCSPIYQDALVGLVVDEAHCVKSW